MSDASDVPSTDTVLAWSGGKDAALCLHALADADLSVTALLTTVNAASDRVSMHGVRRSLLAAQADALDLPVRFVDLPADCANDVYRERTGEALAEFRDRGVTDVAFGDLFLADVRDYRESNLDGTGVAGHWPLWGRDTAALARTFLDDGFRAVVVCVDGDALDASFVGREYDAAFLSDLPDGVDPCGEQGEFHTFVYDGPPFAAPVGVERGERVTREAGGSEFHYCDLYG